MAQDRGQSQSSRRPGSDGRADNVTEYSGEAVVRVEGVSKTFDDGAVTAIDDVSFAADEGQIVGVLGPNGAGKTTLVKSILGLVVHDEGTVTVNGVDVHANPREAARHMDAMLEGARNDYWRLTVRENLRYFATVGGVDPDAVADRHEELLARFDLQERAETPVRELSRGMKQKVSLASVLASGASLVVLDEPTLGLDVESALTLRAELKQLVAEEDITVLLTSHDMDVIEDVADRVLVLNDGEIIADEAVEAVTERFDTRGYRVSGRGFTKDHIAALEDQFEVTDVTRFDDRTTLTVAADSETFYALTRSLEAQEIELLDVESTHADLEEVFLRLTREGER